MAKRTGITISLLLMLDPKPIAKKWNRASNRYPAHLRPARHWAWSLRE